MPKSFALDVVTVLNGGNLPSGELKQDTKNRIEAGLLAGKYIHDVGHIAMIGGQAVEMRDFALAQEPDLEDRIIADNESKDTLGNAHFFKKNLAQPHGWHNILLVTAGFHMPRALWTFRRVLGVDYKIVPMRSETGYDLETRLKLRTLELGYWAYTASLLSLAKPEQDERREKILKLTSSRYSGHNLLQQVIGAFDKRTDIRT